MPDLSIADELAYTGLPEDVKAIVDKYFTGLMEMVGDCRDEIDEAYQRGYDAGRRARVKSYTG